MDRRLIVPTAGGIGLLYCAYMLIMDMRESGVQPWTVIAAAVMLLAGLGALWIAWTRNKVIKKEYADFEKLLEEEAKAKALEENAPQDESEEE